MKVLVCAVDRGGEVCIPDGSFELQANDKITVTAPRSELVKMLKALKISNQKIRDVLIIGGSKIAVYLADELIKSGVNVKIIEQKLDKCRALSERLPGAVIINGDGTLQDLLSSEGIEDTDAVVSLTNIDEETLSYRCTRMSAKYQRLLQRLTVPSISSSSKTRISAASYARKCSRAMR